MNPPIRIVVCEAETGILIDENGKRLISQERSNLSKNSYSEAIEFKNTFLNSYPYAEVTLIDNSEKSERFQSEILQQYLKEKKAYLEYINTPLPLRKLKKEPKCFLYEHPKSS